MAELNTVGLDSVAFERSASGFRPDQKEHRYERLYPDTGIPSAQKEERMERIDFKRTGRISVLIPALPWLKDGD